MQWQPTGCCKPSKSTQGSLIFRETAYSYSSERANSYCSKIKHSCCGSAWMVLPGQARVRRRERLAGEHRAELCRIRALPALCSPAQHPTHPTAACPAPSPLIPRPSTRNNPRAGHGETAEPPCPVPRERSGAPGTGTGNSGPSNPPRAGKGTAGASLTMNRVKP